MVSSWGPVAQLGARLHGMQKVVGSIPIRSTNFSRFWKLRFESRFTTSEVNLNFDQVLSAAWDKHGHNLVLALSELRELSRSVAVEEQIPPLARLCVHVYAEHLGRWEEGREFLSGLTHLSGFSWSGSSGAAVRRSTAIFDFCGGDETVLARLG